MRRHLAVLVPSVLVLPVLLVVAAVSPAAAEATRTIKVELSTPLSAPFAVENLAGHMRVVPGDGATVVAVATVHAESEEIAARFSFDQVAGKAGRPTLRVRYPIEEGETVRYAPRGNDRKSGGWFGGWFGGDSTSTDYDGHRVKVSSGTGVAMHADVEVRVPKTEIEATFRNVVGSLEAEEVRGTLAFDTGSGDQSLRSVHGKTVAASGSGDITATGAVGDLKCSTGSGDCVVKDFEGDRLACSTGSGDVSLGSARAGKVNATTGSGDIHALDLDAEEFIAGTGSGDIDFSARGSRLLRVKADTGSGDVTLRLGPDASFEARADQGSGDIVSRYPDAQPIVKGKEVLGYRRGDGRTQIKVDTGSGDLVLEPGRDSARKSSTGT
jgi:hypothetical protein